MSDGHLAWLFLLQILFVFINAVFACAEIAVVTTKNARLSKLAGDGDRRAARLLILTREPSSFFATIQVGITLVSLLSSAVAAENFSGKLTQWLCGLGTSLPVSALNTLSVALITVALTFFTVVFGELIPKRIAMKNPEKTALHMSGFIYVFSKIFAPAVWLFTAVTNGLLRIFSVKSCSTEYESPEEEIKLVLDEGKQKGTIKPDEQDMIQNIFEFDDICAGDIMTHRTETDILKLEEPQEKWNIQINKSGHSVYPVCSEKMDNIVGVLYAKDYFRAAEKTRENVLKTAVRPAYFVPKTVRADVLFRNMKQTRNHFAVVIDEYGGMSGIITMNDLLEQLVGNLDDISQPEELPLIERISADTWRIGGGAQLDDVSEELGIQFSDDESNTFGGFVFGLLGTIPKDGSMPEIERHGLKIRVSEIREHRLVNAVVSVKNTASNPHVPLRGQITCGAA